MKIGDSCPIIGFVDKALIAEGSIRKNGRTLVEVCYYLTSVFLRIQFYPACRFIQVLSISSLLKNPLAREEA